MMNVNRFLSMLYTLPILPILTLSRRPPPLPFPFPPIEVIPDEYRLDPHSKQTT